MKNLKNKVLKSTRRLEFYGLLTLAGTIYYILNYTVIGFAMGLGWPLS